MPDPKDDPDEIHRRMAPLMEAIGHVAHHWARLEHEINQMIWALSALSPADGACITAQISAIMPRMRALIALADKNGCSKGLLKALNSFSGEADKLSRRRNRVIHDPWFFRYLPDEGGARVEYGRLEVTADRHLVYEIKPQTRKEVLDVAHKITAANKKFRSLRNQIHAELKEQLESRLGTSLEDFLDSPVPDSET